MTVRKLKEPPADNSTESSDSEDDESTSLASTAGNGMCYDLRVHLPNVSSTVVTCVTGLGGSKASEGGGSSDGRYELVEAVHVDEDGTNLSRFKKSSADYSHSCWTTETVRLVNWTVILAHSSGETQDATFFLSGKGRTPQASHSTRHQSKRSRSFRILPKR